MNDDYLESLLDRILCKKLLVFYKNERYELIQPTFYEWLIKNTNYIKNIDVLLATYNMFRQKNLEFDCPDEKKNENKKRLIEMLGNDGFIF